MRRSVLTIIFLMTVALLSVAAIAQAADSPAAGKWSCVAVTPDGDYNWTVDLSEKDGELTGTISGDPGNYDLKDVKFEDGTLSFTVNIQGEDYTVKAKISESKLDGHWEGAGADGTITGTKKS